MWLPFRLDPEFCHVVNQIVLGGPGALGWHQILLEDEVVNWMYPLDPGDQILLQKVLINVNVDSFADDDKNDRTLLAITAHHPEDHLLQSTLGEGRDMDVAVVDSNVIGEDLFI
jgi:hypothetical protein